jgi:hypothetical protein
VPRGSGSGCAPPLSRHCMAGDPRMVRMAPPAVRSASPSLKSSGSGLCQPVGASHRSFVPSPATRGQGLTQKAPARTNTAEGQATWRRLPSASRSVRLRAVRRSSRSKLPTGSCGARRPRSGWAWSSRGSAARCASASAAGSGSASGSAEDRPSGSVGVTTPSVVSTEVGVATARGRPASARASSPGTL